ncbi:restriction endonuclease subunit S [Saccharothrix coeruleofusca]|uniref:restriction endonuclease subunit S n=1 Tax=Saccharothrix coeruleofusca TaxID=33919 RepID=UPI0016713998|nr:restriction endonuclease subunit S [Saccharothrix coeruleofusca]
MKEGKREVVFENIRYVDEHTHATWFRAHPKPGDILFVCKGSPGRVAMVPDPVPYCIAQDMVALRANPVAADAEYLYYRLRSPDVRASIANMHVGTMIPHFKKGDFNKLRFTVHDSISEQRAIAEVLRSLDEKIAINERIVLLLDEWVRSSFTAMAGQSRLLGEFASNIRKQVNPLDVEPGTPYYGLEHLPRRQMWASTVGVASDVTSAKSAFHEGDILFGKLRPYFHKVVAAEGNGVCSTDILVVRSNDPGLAGFVLAACASDDTVRACVAASEGTRMPRTSWKDLRSVPVIWPGESTARSFSVEVSMKSRFAGGLIRESRRLMNTRDELLPLLMSGKVRVREAEKIVEGIV